MAQMMKMTPSEEKMPVEIGLESDARRNLAHALGEVLADSYVLMARTHNFHWNVVGPQFPGLHALFEEQYKELFGAIDVIAERIRSLGFVAPGTLSDFVERSNLDASQTAEDADAMLASLVEGHEMAGRACRKVVELCGETGDSVTEDLMNARIGTHEQFAWMLRASQSR